jgi:hypothetical protein
MKNTKGKKKQILDHLKSGRSITGRDAWSLYGVYRLSSTIHRLRNEGFPIKTTMVPTIEGEDFASYSMENTIF